MNKRILAIFAIIMVLISLTTVTLFSFFDFPGVYYDIVRCKYICEWGNDMAYACFYGCMRDLGYLFNIKLLIMIGGAKSSVCKIKLN